MSVSPEKSPDKKFEDVEFGEDLAQIDVDVSLDNVKVFAQAAQMMADRFINHEKAREAGLPGAIVPGIMSQGILVAMIHRWAPRAQVEKIDTIFRAPLVVDSEPVCRGVVTDMDDDEKTIEVDLTICNEAGETRVLGTAIVSL